ncbi:hypothetical protein SNEBB_001839 [Seison nebaliae]|nr:hypothetical protein SNEBB_001839 [Seison nebaliae]
MLLCKRRNNFFSLVSRTFATDEKRSVKIVEVGPRDGLQNEKMIIPIQTKLEFIRQLIDCGIKNIEVASFVSPKWVPQMADSKELCKKLPIIDNVNYSALVPNERGMINMMECKEIKEIAVFGAVSEEFTKRNANCSIDEAHKRFKPIVQQALNNGIKVRGYISCVWGCPYEGIRINQKQNDKLVHVINTLLEMGCYEIALSDTIGVATANRVTEILKECEKSKISFDKIALHMHDTRGQALCNIKTAYDMGIRVFDSSVGGLGGCPYADGATGNVATEHLVYLFDSLNVEHGIDYEKLLSCGQFIKSYLT